MNMMTIMMMLKQDKGASEHDHTFVTFLQGRLRRDLLSVLAAMYFTSIFKNIYYIKYPSRGQHLSYHKLCKVLMIHKGTDKSPVQMTVVKFEVS